jgi:D-glycero-alpha-D-manno-heptose-7-phosphate kinase
MTTVVARAPLRLGLAGGGSDVDPFCSKYGGRVLNSTIAIYVYSIVVDNDVFPILRSNDQGIQEEPQTEYDGATCRLPLHQAVFEFFRRSYPTERLAQLSLYTYTDAPVGSGLGTSSTLVVSAVKAISDYLGLGLSQYQIADAAQVIERQICGFAGGRQDSYSASFGGFNYMAFDDYGAAITPIRVPPVFSLQLESQFLLFHLGTSRVSSEIIKKQSESVDSGDLETFKAMMKIRAEAKEMRTAILKGDFEAVGDSLRKGWDNKKATSKAVSTDLIDLIHSSALEKGAVAGKVSGAGGGGFMLFMVPLERRSDLIEELGRFGGRILNVTFTEEGATSWRA